MKTYKELSTKEKRWLASEFTHKRREMKRSNAILELSKEQSIAPEAISQLLREEYNNFV